MANCKAVAAASATQNPTSGPGTICTEKVAPSDSYNMTARTCVQAVGPYSSKAGTTIFTRAPVPANDFYREFDSIGRVNIFDSFVGSARPDDLNSICRIYDTVAAERGEPYAAKIVGSYYTEYIERNPVTWETVLLYTHLADSLSGNERKTLRSISMYIRQKVNEFIGDNIHDCPLELKKICAMTNDRESWFEKVMRNFRSGGLPRILMKVTCKIENKLLPQRGDGIRGEFRTEAFVTEPVEGALPGYKIENVYMGDGGDRKKVAVLITGDPKNGAMVGAAISIGGTVKTADIESEYDGRLQYQGPSSYRHGSNLPMELVIYRGNVVMEKPPDARRHDGYIIIFPDGRMHIADKRRIRLSEITGKKEDEWVVLNLSGKRGPYDLPRFTDEMKKLGASQIPTMLLAKNGDIEWLEENGRDERRLLLEFGDGTFGVISTICADELCLAENTEPIGTNDLLILAIRISESRGGIRAASYLDTGYFDGAAYYTYENGQQTRTIIGHPDCIKDPTKDRQTSRLFFYYGDK